MKKVISVIMLALMVFSIAACGGNGGSEIPDVFGLDYVDAIGILEADGFEVSAIETGVESFSVKLLYPLEKVDKGTVFKIDDYIIDQNGHLNKNYDVFYDEGLVSEDKSVVIYYAKEDYVREETENSNVDMLNTQPATTTATEEPTEKVTEEATEVPTETPTEAKIETGLRSDFKEAMDSYEAFMDEYVAFMKKYKANPSDLSLLMEYATFMEEYAEFVEDFEKWDSEDMNEAELAYYLEVNARVTKKLAEII